MSETAFFVRLPFRAGCSGSRALWRVHVPGTPAARQDPEASHSYRFHRINPRFSANDLYPQSVQEHQAYQADMWHRNKDVLFG